ncbi:hypothetical protein GC174_12140 [bacterium]|nr:hypothetical protein [bacterium]
MPDIIAYSEVPASITNTISAIETFLEKDCSRKVRLGRNKILAITNHNWPNQNHLKISIEAVANAQNKTAITVTTFDVHPANEIAVKENMLGITVAIFKSLEKSECRAKAP